MRGGDGDSSSGTLRNDKVKTERGEYASAIGMGACGRMWREWRCGGRFVSRYWGEVLGVVGSKQSGCWSWLNGGGTRKGQRDSSSRTPRNDNVGGARWDACGMGGTWDWLGRRDFSLHEAIRCAAGVLTQ